MEMGPSRCSVGTTRSVVGYCGTLLQVTRPKTEAGTLPTLDQDVSQVTEDDSEECRRPNSSRGMYGTSNGLLASSSRANRSRCDSLAAPDGHLHRIERAASFRTRIHPRTDARRQDSGCDTSQARSTTFPARKRASEIDCGDGAPRSAADCALRVAKAFIATSFRLARGDSTRGRSRAVAHSRTAQNTIRFSPHTRSGSAASRIRMGRKAAQSGAETRPWRIRSRG